MLLGEGALLKTEILARGRELARALEEVRDGSQQQERILAIVSHDLRTPLSSIRVGLRALEGHFEGAPRPGVLDALASSAARMTELLNDLTDYTPVRLQGLLSVRRERVDLRAICREIVVSAQLAHPGQIVELASGGAVAAYADPKRLRQALANLVENALTYGLESRRVRVSVRPVTGACVVTVSNEGTPIAEDVLPVLFQPFRRGPDGERRGGHLGLGLYIVHQIVRAHEGAVDVRSTPQGTHFSVYLPSRDVGALDG